MKIKRQTLLAMHPSISATLNNMGIVFRKEGTYNKALDNYTQTLRIEQTILPLDTLDLVDTYNNLCVLHMIKTSIKKSNRDAPM